MKKVFLFMATMLLSIGTFAQNELSLKGDLNGDGKVDVADINAIIAIMKDGGLYWYLGSEQPTVIDSETWTPTTQDAGFSVNVTVPAGTSWLAFPDEWLYSAVETPSGENFLFDGDIDAATNLSVPGCVLYKKELAASCDVTIAFTHKVYYWYVGQTNPSSMNSIDPIVDDNYSSSPGWRRIGNLNDSYSSNNPLWDGAANIIVTGPTKATTYVALPNEKLKVRVSEGDVADAYVSSGTQTIEGITYYIYQVSNLKIFNGIIF